jgi:cysteine desulfurase / selenocysteine lyase
MNGGGTVEFVLPDRVLWAEAPERQEAGTPSVLHAIALAMAVQICSPGRAPRPRERRPS